MAITPVDLLRTAELLANDPTEVFQRAAASRAYYAAFHFCAPIARSLPLGLPNGRLGTHQRVIRALIRFDGSPRGQRKQVRFLGHRLRQARDLRSRADYELQRDFTASDAELAVDLARQVLGSAGDMIQFSR